MRHLVAWIAGLAAGGATGATIYALARRKGMAAVEKAGEGGFVYFLIAIGALLVGGGAYRATKKYLDRRAEAQRIPPARTLE